MSLPIKQTLSSATRGAWIPLDPLKNPFNVSIACVCSSNINATYSVEYSHDSPAVAIGVLITRATTTATVTGFTNHGLTTNDSIIVTGTGDSNLDGTYQVASVVDQNSITYTVANTGAVVATAGEIAPMRVFTHPTIAAKTANNDGNIAFPVRAIRLRITAYTAGYVTMIVNQAGV